MWFNTMKWLMSRYLEAFTEVDYKDGFDFSPEKDGFGLTLNAGGIGTYTTACFNDKIFFWNKWWCLLFSL